MWSFLGFLVITRWVSIDPKMLKHYFRNGDWYSFIQDSCIPYLLKKTQFGVFLGVCLSGMMWIMENSVGVRSCLLFKMLMHDDHFYLERIGVICLPTDELSLAWSALVFFPVQNFFKDCHNAFEWIQIFVNRIRKLSGFIIDRDSPFYFLFPGCRPHHISIVLVIVFEDNKF